MFSTRTRLFKFPCLDNDNNIADFLKYIVWPPHCISDANNRLLCMYGTWATLICNFFRGNKSRQ
jgi:hypothetical protein